VHQCSQVQIRNDILIEEEAKRKHKENHIVYYMGCLFCQKKMQVFRHGSMRSSTIERHIRGGSCSAFCTTHGIERNEAEMVYLTLKSRFINVISYYVAKRREIDSQARHRKSTGSSNPKMEASSPRSLMCPRTMCQDSMNAPGFHVYFISHEGTPLEEIKAMQLCLESAKSETSACRHKLLRPPRMLMKMAHPIIQIDANTSITEVDLRTLHTDVEREFESIIRQNSLRVQIRLLDNGVPSTSTLKMAKTYEDDPNVILYVVLTSTGKTIENMIMNWRSPPFPRTNLPPVLVLTSQSNIAIVKRRLERIYDESLLDYQVCPPKSDTSDGFVIIQAAIKAYLNDQRQRKTQGKEHSKVFTKGFVDCIPGDKTVFVYENCEGIMGKANTVSWIYAQRVLERLGGGKSTWSSSPQSKGNGQQPSPSPDCLLRKKAIVFRGQSWLTRDFLHVLSDAVNCIHKCQFVMSARVLPVFPGSPCIRVTISSKDSKKLEAAYGFVYTLTRASSNISISTLPPEVSTDFKSKRVWQISGHLYSTGYMCEMMKMLFDKKVRYECVDILVGATADEKSKLKLNVFDASEEMASEILASLHRLDDEYQMAQIRITKNADDPAHMQKSSGKMYFLLEGHVFRSGVWNSIMKLSDNSRILSTRPGRSHNDPTKVVVQSSMTSMQKIYMACTQEKMSSFGLKLRLLSHTEAMDLKKEHTTEIKQSTRESYIEVFIGDMQGRHAKRKAWALWNEVDAATDSHGRTQNRSRPFQTRLRCINQSEYAIEMIGGVARSYETKLSELRGIVELSMQKVGLGAKDVQVTLRYIPCTRVTFIAPAIIEKSKIKLFVVQTETGDTIRAIRSRCKRRDEVRFVMAVKSCDEERAKLIANEEAGMEIITFTDVPRHPRMLVELALKGKQELLSRLQDDNEIGIVYHSDAGSKNGRYCIQVMKCKDLMAKDSKCSKAAARGATTRRAFA